MTLCKNKCFSLEQSCWCLFIMGFSHCRHYSSIPFVNTRGCCFNPSIGLARSVPISKATLDAALKALLGTFFVRLVVEARVSNTPNFGFNDLDQVTSLDYEHLEVINRCDAETSSGLFVFKDRIVCVCVKSTLKSETNIEGKEKGKKGKAGSE